MAFGGTGLGSLLGGDPFGNPQAATNHFGEVGLLRQEMLRQAELARSDFVRFQRPDRYRILHSPSQDPQNFEAELQSEIDDWLKGIK